MIILNKCRILRPQTKRDPTSYITECKQSLLRYEVMNSVSIYLDAFTKIAYNVKTNQSVIFVLNLHLIWAAIVIQSSFLLFNISAISNYVSFLSLPIII